MIKIIAILAVIMCCSATYIPVVPPKAIIIEKPTPYAFGFDVTDEYGTTLQRQESGDGNGAVKGSYSYKDAQGLTRVVDYVADAAGFRANVNTNEPGTETSNPADVKIIANPIKVAVPVAAPKLVAKPLLPLVTAKPLAPLVAAPPVLSAQVLPGAPYLSAPFLASKPILAFNPWTQQKWI